jgi:hypothetical protein
MKKAHIWGAFHNELQLYYYNGEHIYDTPNRVRDYARLNEPVMEGPLWQFINQLTAFHVSEEHDPDGKYAEARERCGKYDEQKMRQAILDILKVVEKPMLETAEKVQSYVTIAVLEKVREWVDNPS